MQPIEWMGMLRGLALSIVLLIVGLGAPAGAQVVDLKAATVTGDHYAGWHVYLPTKGLVMVTTTAASLKTASLTTWLVRTSDWQDARPVTTGGAPVGVGLGGLAIGTPIPFANNGSGSVLDPGDYLVVAMAGGGPGSFARVQATVPTDATILERVSGRAWNLNEQDFADPGSLYIEGPNVDSRSVHGHVTVQANHTFFAWGLGCPGTTLTITGPDGQEPWPLVYYGSPGSWTFSMDLSQSTPGTLPGTVCTSRYVAIDLQLPGPVPPPPY